MSEKTNSYKSSNLSWVHTGDPNHESWIVKGTKIPKSLINLHDHQNYPLTIIPLDKMYENTYRFPPLFSKKVKIEVLNGKEEEIIKESVDSGFGCLVTNKEEKKE